jgi:hypothetical protein
MKHLLTGERPPAPAPLVVHYPELGAHVERAGVDRLF